MWRKQLSQKLKTNSKRNTSTYVEKTFAALLLNEHPQKHLHVCGENSATLPFGLPFAETPPRMWRKLALLIYRIGAEGNTSTYVEKTLRSGSRKLVIWKHLHVCGENLVGGDCTFNALRNTSTYVEKTIALNG